MPAWRMSGGEIGMLVLETVLRIRREFASRKAIKAIARDLRLSQGDPGAGRGVRLSTSGAAVAAAGVPIARR